VDLDHRSNGRARRDLSLVAANAAAPSRCPGMAGGVSVAGALFWLTIVAARHPFATLTDGRSRSCRSRRQAGHGDSRRRPAMALDARSRRCAPASWSVQVTAEDVNHGFAIYQGKSRIIAQAQAMPGYVNKLQVRFAEPGDYEVLCLEYCGLAHHGMRATIKVQ
jgi:hypothetical protein